MARAGRRQSRSACRCWRLQVRRGALVSVVGLAEAWAAACPGDGRVQQLPRDVQTGGRGYIGLAAMIFGNWRPGGCRWAPSLFGSPRRSACARVATRSTRCCWSGAVAGVAACGSSARAGPAGRGRWSRRWAARRAAGGDVLPHRRGLGDSHAVTSSRCSSLPSPSQRLRTPAADGQIYRKGSAG